ncbi:hypothetical protein E2C01_056572 [Portunus trituberculatus]|uniref:Uncharacterized protein n=1 Tax=Portunus trituberculatus TaxID=210409 RepID=A0A5B7GZJ7_PORTR|nr:hypothetical protein [Portunus trituberculatus]
MTLILRHQGACDISDEAHIASWLLSAKMFFFDEYRLSHVFANAEKVTSQSFQEAAADALKRKTAPPTVSFLFSDPAAKPSTSGLSAYPRKSFTKAILMLPQADSSCPNYHLVSWVFTSRSHVP